METNKLPISKNIILIPLLLITVFTVVEIGLIDLYFNRTVINRVEKDLTRLAYSGANMLDLLGDNAKLEDFDNFAGAFAVNNRFRVTIIDLTGIVLGDSFLSIQEIRQMENLADRPEILEAKEAGIGISRRYSKILHIDFLYVAVRHNSLGRKGYFRVALPLTDLQNDLMRQHAILAVFCFIGLLIASSLSLIASRYFLSQVRKSEKHLEQRVNERTKEIETLQNLATQLTACNSKKEALEVIKLITSILLPRFAGALALYNSSKDKLEVVENWNGRWQGEKIYSPDQCWALRSGQTHFGDPRAGNMTCNHSDSQEDKMLCIPIVAQGMTYGVLHFSSSRKAEWTPEEYQLTSAVAEHASLTLASLESRESLRQQAIRDPLTGLYNRRYLFETIEQELSRASRRNQSIGILMVDIDHFKKFNDEFGHDIGDFILSEFGRLIKMIIRNEDIACRFGGEEFTILLPETGRDEAFRVAEKIRIKIRDYDFILKNRSYGPIKLSVGVVSFPENGKTADHLLKMADNALYEAKQAGRDRVVLAENLNKNTG